MKIPPNRPGLSGLLRQRGEAAFTLVELVVVIGIVAFLSMILFGIGQSVRQRTSAATCVSNLKQISIASAAYSVDHQGLWPPNDVVSNGTNLVFIDSLLPYFQRIPLKNDSDFLNSPFICPADRGDIPDSQYYYKGVYLVRSRGLSYAQNGNLFDLSAKRRVGTTRSAVQHLADLVLYMDFTTHYVLSDARLREAGKDRVARLQARHGGTLNAAFADGSVRPVLMDDIPSEVPSRFWQGRDH
ncbi:MAG TPA: prepilin-type N-terminal cleavage/methylation domain-containing protein [Chthoniobacteraceae bacterium]|nr:prepilin-type N-terminal cleavage/methylation domain-containing protein [Chthoniobacteraceae bacterium]